jgi:hypothetical protein
MKRSVKKGEKGIPIFVPMWVKDNNPDSVITDDDGKKLYFKVAYVFDISQTEGEEIDDRPDLPKTNDHEDVYNDIINYATSLGLRFIDGGQTWGASGNTDGHSIINVSDSISIDAKATVGLHEIAHCLLDHKERRKETSKKLREIEAESVAHVVGMLLGLPVERSAFYLADKGASSDDIKEAYQRVTECVKTMYNGLIGHTEEISLQSVA